MRVRRSASTNGLDTEDGSTSYRHWSARTKKATLLYRMTVKRLRDKGVSCPAPASCNCHCDCPDTQYVAPPPLPPPCPVYPVFPTSPPAPRKPKKKVEAVVEKTEAKEEPKEKKPIVASCKLGEVSTAEGKCLKITKEVILALKGQVADAFALLRKDKKTYDELSEGKNVACVACSAQRTVLKKTLLIDHQQYKRALDMLAAALAMMPADEAKAVEEKEPEPVPEFALPGEKLAEDVKPLGREHCETWTLLNST